MHAGSLVCAMEESAHGRRHRRLGFDPCGKILEKAESATPLVFLPGVIL